MMANQSSGRGDKVWEGSRQKSRFLETLQGQLARLLLNQDLAAVQSARVVEEREDGTEASHVGVSKNYGTAKRTGF